MRAGSAELSLQFGTSERLPVTVSAGICYVAGERRGATELLAVATRRPDRGQGERRRRGPRRRPDAERPGVAQRSSFDVLTGLVVAVDTKDHYTKQHSEDVARYALFLADRIGLDPDERRAVELAGLLHDVGKIGIPGHDPAQARAA